jgi:hypothetical protein
MYIPQQSPPVNRDSAEDSPAKRADGQQIEGVQGQVCVCPNGTYVCRYGKQWVDTGIPCTP